MKWLLKLFTRAKYVADRRAIVLRLEGMYLMLGQPVRRGPNPDKTRVQLVSHQIQVNGSNLHFVAVSNAGVLLGTGIELVSHQIQVNGSNLHFVAVSNAGVLLGTGIELVSHQIQVNGSNLHFVTVSNAGVLLGTGIEPGIS